MEKQKIDTLQKLLWTMYEKDTLGWELKQNLTFVLVTKQLLEDGLTKEEIYTKYCELV